MDMAKNVADFIAENTGLHKSADSLLNDLISRWPETTLADLGKGIDFARESRRIEGREYAPDADLLGGLAASAIKLSQRAGQSPRQFYGT